MNGQGSDAYYVPSKNESFQSVAEKFYSLDGVGDQTQKAVRDAIRAANPAWTEEVPRGEFVTLPSLTVALFRLVPPGGTRTGPLPPDPTIPTDPDWDPIHDEPAPGVALRTYSDPTDKCQYSVSEIIQKNGIQEKKSITGHVIFVRYLGTRTVGGGPLTASVVSQYAVILAHTGLIRRWQLQQHCLVKTKKCPDGTTWTQRTPTGSVEWVYLAPPLPWRGDEEVQKTFWTVLATDAMKFADDYHTKNHVVRGADEL